MVTEEISIKSEYNVVRRSFFMLLNHIFKTCINLKKLELDIYFTDIITEGIELFTESPLNLEELRLDISDERKESYLGFLNCIKWM